MSKILIFTVLAISSQLSYGIDVNCTFEMIIWTTLGSMYTCTASISIDTGSRETITAISGAHLSGKTHVHVLALIIPDSGMEYFPVNIAQFFPNIRALDFRFNSISYVNNEHLIEIPNLSYVQLYSNRITSLDSNLFSGLSIQYIDFRVNNIKHVGHDFILPNTGRIYFNSNPCIDSSANTPDGITALRLSLLVNCPPTISQIEDTLESRSNWLTDMNGQVRILVSRTDEIEQSHSEIDGEVRSLTNAVTDLENRNFQLTNKVTDLEESNAELISEVTDLQKSNVQLINTVTELEESNVELTSEVADLQQNNLELSNEVTDVQLKNSQLETRIGYLNTRASNLEVRVAVLESIIESRLGLNIDEAINEILN